MINRNAIHRLVWGTPFQREYLCTPLESHHPKLEIWANGIRNITENHLLLGYRPLLIGVWGENAEHMMSLEWRQHDAKKARAKVALKSSEEIPFGPKSLRIFEGVKGWQKFLPQAIQWRHNLRQRIKGKRDAAYIAPSIYDQVKAAYALPRKISVVSVGTVHYGNIFPTDLHGPLPGGYYAVSLREAGQAHRQVLKSGEILLTDVKVEQAGKVYALGKNHMKALRKLCGENNLLSEYDELLPVGAKSFLRLERIAGKTISIHHIHIFKIVEQVTLDESGETLAHIHRDYATWRWRQGMATQYVQR